ncbi:hypothetical protein [Endozoicomonas arenosclerae]|uniref:hypothetical protein n=1 Tax=Endozoicomonas arenosclerae TaxID=1633495 RepID=UPI00129475EB
MQYSIRQASPEDAQTLGTMIYNMEVELWNEQADQLNLKDFLKAAEQPGQLHQFRTTEQSSFFRCLWSHPASFR